MGAVSSIEWTDATWNPVRGCSMAKGSETGGCRYCYAARISAQNRPGQRSPTTGNPFAKFLPIGPRWTGNVEFIEKLLGLPLGWKRPRRIFVNSMSDLFHEALPDEVIDRIFAAMALCPRHTFQVLTKRPDRMLAWVSSIKDGSIASGRVRDILYRWPRFNPRTRLPRRTDIDAAQQVRWPLPNVWLGVSIENQATADARIPLLLQTPAAKRFISYEPALGPISLDGAGATDLHALGCGGEPDCNCGTTRLDWVICGGESGPDARPMAPDWARSVRDQCVEAGVPFFFKQWGEWTPHGLAAEHKYLDVPVGDGTHHRMFRVGKKLSGALLDGREWKEFPHE